MLFRIVCEKSLNVFWSANVYTKNMQEMVVWTWIVFLKNILLCLPLRYFLDIVGALESNKYCIILSQKRDQWVSETMITYINK